MKPVTRARIPAWVVYTTCLFVVTIPLIFFCRSKTFGLLSLANDRGPTLTVFRTLFLLVTAATLMLFYLAPRVQDLTLGAGSLAFLFFVYRPGISLTLIVAVICMHFMHRVRRGPWKLFVFLTWLGFFCFFLPPLFLHLETINASISAKPFDPHGMLAMYLLMSFFKRGIWWYYDLNQSPRLEWTARDLFRYMLGLPNLIGLAATPSFRHFITSRQAGSAEVLRSGAIASSICIAWLIVAIVIRLAGWQWWMASPHVPARYDFDLAWLSILGLRWMSYVARLYDEQLTVGLWRLFGYNLRDDYRNPLWSRNVVEFWQRWNLLWREFLLQVFYYPLLLSLGHKYGALRPWMYFVAVMATFGGAYFFDVLPVGYYMWCLFPSEGVAMGIWFLVYHLLFGLAVGVSLFWAKSEQTRRVSAPRKTDSPGAIGRWIDHALSVGTTYVFLSLLNICHQPSLSSQKLELIANALH